MSIIKQRRSRIAAGIVLAGLSGFGLLAVSATAAQAAGGSVYNRWVNPGGEVCYGSHAESSVTGSGGANVPGLKFKLLYQTGAVVAGSGTPGPVTSYGVHTQTGYYNWLGAGDYTLCAKNNGTSSVFLNYLTIDTV